MLAAFGVFWQLGLVPGSQLSVPPPMAVQGAPPATAHSATSTAQPVVPTPDSSATPSVAAQTAPTRTVPVAPITPPVLTSTPVALLPADAQDRKRPTAVPGGYAIRLVIPSINLDTPVTQGGIVDDGHGNPIWGTLPFVAVHYGSLTSLLGLAGNAVISGHVVTINEGNVFRLLYRLEIDDQIQVWDQLGREHDYHVVDAKLVPPSDVSVMQPTPDETLTLITCGGSFDRIRREFSDRLIVTAKPLAVPD
jgi:LPXTG-site transpeptidase (sortase) family protein